MGKFIALLRGINVSGQKKIKMSELKTHLQNVGLHDVQTYIQSGNIIFSSTEKETDILAKKIAQAIHKNYDFHVETVKRIVHIHIIPNISESPILYRTHRLNVDCPT